MEKLKNYGASLLWLISALVFIAQGYRAVMYYIVDMPVDWTWQDIVVFGIAFMAMFTPAKLKTIVVDTAKRVASRK